MILSQGGKKLALRQLRNRVRLLFNLFDFDYDKVTGQEAKSCLSCTKKRCLYAAF